MDIPLTKKNSNLNIFFLPAVSIILGIITVYFQIQVITFILAIFVFVLLRNKSEFIISAMIISTLIFDEIIIQKLGIPSLGFNLLDFFVILLLLIVAYKLLKNKTIKINRTLFCLLTLFLLGSFSLVYGAQSGFPLRGALRDYRTFVYLLTMYWVIQLDFKNNQRKIAFVLVALYLSVLIQFVLIGLGKLVVNPVMRQHPTYIIGAGANLSAWHFVAGYSYFPMIISIGLLKNNYRALKRRIRVFLLLTVFISLIVVIASFNRAMYTIFPLILLWMMTRDIRKKATLRKNFYTALGIIAVFSFVLLIARLQGKDDFNAALLGRIFYLKDIGEVSIHSRLVDARLTSEYILRSPLIGYGLGADFSPPPLSATERKLIVSGTGMHMGYLWLAYRVGIPALVLFLYILWITLQKGRRFLRRCAKDSLDRGLMVGLLGCLMLCSLATVFSTSIVFFKELPYWGLVIGLIHILIRQKEPQIVK